VAGAGGARLMARRRRARCAKLSKEMKALVYAPPESNAGAGWVATRDIRRDAKSLDMMDVEYRRGAGRAGRD
jgi:hypothetical protein